MEEGAHSVARSGYLLRVRDAARAEASTPDVFMLRTQMLIDVRTRDITIDLESLDGRRSTRSARQDTDEGVEPRTRIALGRPGNERGKRIVDVLIVIATSPLWLPALALLACAVRCTSHGPAFYSQERVGR